ncbi:MAG: hypothetical protein AB1540_14555 [Bdellovibrionota bacterium]
MIEVKQEPGQDEIDSIGTDRLEASARSAMGSSVRFGPLLWERSAPHDRRPSTPTANTLTIVDFPAVKPATGEKMQRGFLSKRHHGVGTHSNELRFL